MADGLRLVLWSLAEYFNYFSITLIILCFVLMTAFIVRLNGDQWGQYRHTPGQGGSSLAQQKDVTGFTNPFFLSLSTTTVSSLSDGVFVELSCLKLCDVHVYWGASINAVHAALLKTGADFVADVRRQTLLRDPALATSEYSVRTPGKRTVHLRVPTAVTSEILGSPPRLCYPCVIVLATINDISVAEYTEVVALVTVLHLKDSMCSMETHIISQYAKMAGQAVFNLRPLFFATSSDDSSDVQTSQSACQNSDQQGDQQQSQSCDEENTSPTSKTTTADVCSAGGSGHSTRHRHITDISQEQPPSCTQRPGDSSSSEDYQCSGAGIDDTASDLPCHVEETAREPELSECVVCQHKRLNYVLLPCRHACVCQTCFRRLDRCPMCRSHIESYFTLREEEDIPTPVPDEPVPTDLTSRFERFNHRLNAFFGFE